jgi:hypothetical protein
MIEPVIYYELLVVRLMLGIVEPAVNYHLLLYRLFMIGYHSTIIVRYNFFHLLLLN